MEPKVINTAVSTANSSPSDWCYAASNSYAEQSGSGNNWARGHNLYGPKHAEVICELVRREVTCSLLCLHACFIRSHSNLPCHLKVMLAARLQTIETFTVIVHLET